MSSTAIALGAYIELQTGGNKGILITFAGFIGMALSGFLMTIAYGAPEK